MKLPIGYIRPNAVTARARGARAALLRSLVYCLLPRLRRRPRQRAQECAA